MFVGVGLPQIAALAGKAESYAERLFDYPEIGPLEPEAADQAIAEPAAAEGVSFEPEALNGARAATNGARAATAGYPYFLQESARGPRSASTVASCTSDTPGAVR